MCSFRAPSSLVRLSFLLAFAALWIGVPRAQAPVPAAPTGPSRSAGEPAAVEFTPAIFAGLWDYNAAESINIQTGRPEQAPRSATQRGARVGGPAPPPVRGRGAENSGESANPFGVPVRRGSTIGPTPEMIRETQGLQRDLLEVPETLTIAIADTTVTFTDDLARERTYATDGRKLKYQLGAAQYEARAAWQGPQLRKEIEGAYGFRMNETYFLSADAKRLFVIVRVGEPKRNEPQIGYNRVYDRVERPAQD